MDHVNRQRPDIYSLFVFSALVMVALTGCGGGGGGGGSSRASSSLSLTEPPISALPPRPSLKYSSALVLDAFPNLTPQQAARRLLTTASYDGLETADGCTLSKCGESEMRSVFGRGLVNLEKAIQPIGTLSLLSD